ncbi:MAG: hypothetical protein KDD19_14550 [Phaeodactylibacter sp.]|nr:hypothetical protein [Phaeodactylibacter sp.]MCB9047889.1 hypothetical protein [Lewinellaceae bacterium]
MLSQDDFKERVAPLMKKEGALYAKKVNVMARKAVAGEAIQTVTESGLETVNTAEEGDYIVTNKTEARESYILKPSTFHQKYTLAKTGEAGLDEYISKGKIIALELTADILAQLGLSDTFYFEAPWKQPMKACLGDFLASPTDYSEVYRIARKEFFETYSQ